MAANITFDWRRADRRVYLTAAIAFAVIVLAGFGRTYYFKMFTGTPPLPSMLVHIHGIVMTAWVALFAVQVWLIRTKKPKVHMSLGMLGIALAMLVIVVGFFTSASAAKFGSASAPPDVPPLAFFIVPFVDIIFFAVCFAAAIYYRTNLANHKRLMLLTAISFLPPAVARIPLEFVPKLGPILFMGVPAAMVIGFLIYDTWRHKKLNRVFLIGGTILVVSYPLRMIISGTGAWMSFATWVTSWAA